MRLATLCTLGLLSACGPTLQPGGSAQVALVVEPTRAAAGDSVTLELRNHAAEPLGYNLCASALERLDGGTWRPVPSDRICTMELRILAPGEKARFRAGLPTSLEPGEYAFVTGVERMESGGREGVRSNPLRVGA